MAESQRPLIFARIELYIAGMQDARNQTEPSDD